MSPPSVLVSLAFLLAFVPPALGRPPAASQVTAERISFDDGWRFHRGDAPGAERPEFDDARWRVVDIPHDWAIEGPFAESNGPSAGGLPFFGTGWYRKHFSAPAPAAGGTRVWVELDGAMANSTVWLNGHELGGRPYGYIGFGFDLTRSLKPGDNVLAVRLQPEPESSRWYPGAGLYRHVWLDVSAPVHVGRWSTVVTTPRIGDADADVKVATAVENTSERPLAVDVAVTITAFDGRLAARSEPTRLTVAAGSRVELGRDLRIEWPARWDIEAPVLYAATVTLTDPSGAVADRQVTRFGIRTLSFTAQEGFALNGRRMKLHGVCLHHDLGALGAAVSRAAIARQLRIMRAMGVNAIRTSHNPPAPELLDLADEMGFLVIDEAFDMWGRTKIKNGHGKYFAEWSERDLRDMIRRDRNHPSVVLWSIGNEILEQDEPAGAGIARRLKAICREEDPTRLVTAGLNQLDNALRFGIAAAVDVVGLNYQARHYERVLAEHPDWMIYAAESASTVSSRGVYLPLEKYQKHPSRQISSYDIIAPRWAYAPDPEFAAQDRLPQVLGEFVWTGFDYLGEPTPYYGWLEPPDPNDWPARSSYFGIVDLAGFPKDRYFLYQSMWTSAPMVHLLPHWTWPGREGQAIPVMAYTNAEAVELFLDGVSLGRRTRGRDLVRLPVGTSVNDSGSFDSPYRLSWEVPYRAGTLRAVAYRGDRAVARTEVRTAGRPARLSLAADRATLAADGRDLAFVTVRVEDASGIPCPTADTRVVFSVKGAGSIAAVDNGDPATTAPFQADHRDAFNGLALLVVRAGRGAGAIEIVASADGLESGRMVVDVK